MISFFQNECICCFHPINPQGIISKYYQVQSTNMNSYNKKFTWDHLLYNCYNCGHIFNLLKPKNKFLKNYYNSVPNKKFED